MFLKLAKKQSIVTSLAVLTLPLVVISCGGGGGGAATPTSGGDAPTNTIAITSSNASAIASLALISNLSGNAGSTPPPVAVVVTNTNSKSKKSITEISRDAMSRVQRYQGKYPASLTGVVTKLDCDNVGTGTITIDDNTVNNGTTFSGSLSLTFSNCLQITTTTNGSFSISGSGASDGSAFDGKIIFSNLTTTESTNSIPFSVNGSANVSSTSSPTLETNLTNGTLISFKYGTDIFDYSAFSTDSSYNITTNIETTDDNYTISVSTATLKGSVTVATIVPVKDYLATPYPSDGQIVISGASGSKIRLTVKAGGTGLPSDLVTIEVDADGDGTYESSQDSAWQSL